MSTTQIVITIALTSVFCIALCITVYFGRKPANVFEMYELSGGGTVTVGRFHLSYTPPPDYYPENGFEHIDSYVRKLVDTNLNWNHLTFFTPDGKRGFGLDRYSGQIQATMFVEWETEPEKEQAILQLFAELGFEPTNDYLASNGGNVDSTRILEYPIKGNAEAITALTKRILEDISKIDPAEALNIQLTK